MIKKVTQGFNMLGLLVMALTCFMIFTLVRNALVGIQLSADEIYSGSVELIIPVTGKSEFYLEPWIKSLESFKTLGSQLKIHILVDGHHPAMAAWQELHNKLPYVELHSFPMRPEGTYPVPWMIKQISSQIIGQVVIIGDSELVPTEEAFTATGKLIQEKQRPYFILPQTEHLNLVGEAVAILNPNLLLASVFGFRKYRKNISHPLMSLAQGWMAMPLETFQKLDFGITSISSWKQIIVKQWDQGQVNYALAFGEKQIKRHYPEVLGQQIHQLKDYWQEIWHSGDRAGLWLFIVGLFIWSFPVLCFFSHPFWALAIIALLCVYRFFSKIVFQESLRAVLLHPLACVIWLGSLIWWLATGLKSPSGTQGPARS